MSVLAQQHLGHFHSERRTAQPASSSVNKVEYYRSLHEESQVAAVAAQAEVTSLQLQLDKAQLELDAQDKSVKTLTEQNTMLKSLVAAKEEKLQVFSQKLATIKAAVTREVDKKRSGNKDGQLTLNCILRCCYEFCTHMITAEEFHLAVDLILSTLTSHPHILTTSTSSQEVEFGEEGRQQLNSLPLPQRQLLLAEISSRTGFSAEELVNREVVSPPPPFPDNHQERGSTDRSPAAAVCVGSEERGGEGGGEGVGEGGGERVGEGVGEGGGQRVGEGGGERVGEGGGGKRVGEGDEKEGRREEEGEREKKKHGEYESMHSATLASVKTRTNGQVKRKYRSTSADMINIHSMDTARCGGVGEPCPREQRVQAWRRRLGLREGSIFTGSLPDLEVSGSRVEEEEEEEDDEYYIDPRELASAIIDSRLNRRMSQRVMRRMGTMMSQTTPTYLTILPPEISSDVVPLKKVSSAPVRGAKSGEGEEGEGGDGWTTDDDILSVDWDAEDERERVSTSSAQSAVRDNGARRRLLSSKKSARLSLEESIYECIDDITLPMCDISNQRGLKFEVPRQVPLPHRRSRAASHHRRRLSKMKAMDGYEYLDALTPVDGTHIPMWRDLSPALPPPRKISAPPPGRPHPNHHIPLDTSYSLYSPAISSDETNHSDPDTISELLYTTPSFVTMKTRPHPLNKKGTLQNKVKEEDKCDKPEWVKGNGHKPLQPTKSHTLPAPSNRHHPSKRVSYCGYLTKLDSRLRPGKRRWFVLVGSELRYYRNKESSLDRPRKIINLNTWCKLAVVNDVIFKLITTQTYHLSGGSAAESAGWVQALCAVLQRPSKLPPSSGAPPSPPPPPSPSLSGWAHTTEKGATRKLWCQLKAGTLSFSQQAQAEPVQRVDMTVSSVRKVRDSLLMDNKDSSTTLSSQLAIQEEGEEMPLLLVPCNAEDKEAWFYQLSLASCRGRDEMLELTPTEQHLATICRKGGTLDHPLWQHPVLNATDCPLRSSLTSLPSASLTSKAFRLFQNVQMFMSTPLSCLSLDGHVTAAQHVISTCQRHPQLQDELYCQLLRQLTSTTDLVSRSLQQGWCLLSLAVPMFFPHRPRISWYLSAFLRRSLASSQPIVTGFAQHCLDTVERVRETGTRKWRPSCQELGDLLSQFALNPSSLKISLSLPVQLPDGTTEELEFDASSTVNELLTQLNTKLGMPPSEESGFSLMSDWPGVEECAFFHLPPTSKLGDLLACWWHAMEELHPNGSTTRNRCICLTYRNRLFMQSRQGKETDKEVELLAYQISHDVLSGRHPVREGIKMAAIMAQLEYGDWESVGEGEGKEGDEEVSVKKSAISREALMKFSPMKLTQMTLEHDQSLYQRSLVKHWGLCAGKSRAQCARDFLKLAQYWQLCGATLFLAEMGHGQSVWLAVHEAGISLLSPSSMAIRDDYSYSQLTAFGEDGDHLVLVTSSQQGSHSNAETEKLLLFMSKGKIHQATNLMTNYIENRTD